MSDPVEQARACSIAAVRDGIRYDPYIDYTDPETYRASSVLAKGHGYCVGKASLYVALCRAAGIPARLGLADVKNHLATPRLLETVGTDVFAYHGYVEIMPGENGSRRRRRSTSACARSSACRRWISPARPTRCCSRSTPPAATFMSYVAQHGTFFDVPAKFLIGEMTRLYPKLCRPGGLRGDMEDEAQALSAFSAEQLRQLLLDLGLHRIGGAQDGARLQEAERAERCRHWAAAAGRARRGGASR